MKKYENYSSLVLAYIGDAIYEVYIRKFLIDQGLCKVKELQETAVSYVSAKAQYQFLQKWMDNHILTEKELEIVKRGRNHGGTRHPKNTDIITYKYATGFEALIGYLYMEGNQERLNVLIDYILKEKTVQGE